MVWSGNALRYFLLTINAALRRSAAPFVIDARVFLLLWPVCVCVCVCLGVCMGVCLCV